MCHFRSVWVWSVFLWCLVSLHVEGCSASSRDSEDDDDDQEEVEILQGRLTGELMTSRGGNDYLAYKGIPYGKVPIRFEPPEPAEAWEGVFEATEFGPKCPQFDRALQKVVGEEECLTLNVYVPTDNQDSMEDFPVVVYIHGGAFQFGSGNDYGGSFFTDEGVILVTVNYRLNALGFLSTGDSVIQGNMGLKDQSLALKWIQENIESFGGDPNRVTLMGTSAGAAAVSFQVLSPMSAGLFHRAQMTSGTALTSWSLHPNAKSTARDLAEHLDCPRAPSTALAGCLRKTDFRKIVEIRLARWNVDPLCTYAPVVETLRPGQSPSDVFLAEDPYTLTSEGRFNKVPLIMGMMEDEGLLFHSAGIMKSPELQRNMNEQWNEVAPITLLYDKTPGANADQLVEISRTIRGFYFGQKRINPEVATNLTNLYSDRYFNTGIKKAALLQAKFTPVYAFIFGFQGAWSILNLYYGDAYKEPIGVSHGDDMQYLFDSYRFPLLKHNSKSEHFSKSLVRLYSGFAKTGNVMESMGIPKVPWMPVGPVEIKLKRLKWYFLDTQPKVIVREPFTERLEFWEKIDAQLKSFSDINTSTATTTNSNSDSTSKDAKDSKEKEKQEL